jgi:hypothetical protein
MYRIDFLQFNGLMQEVMSEEDTLQNIIDIWFNCKPNKEQKKYLTNAEEWAKYAFENNEHYVKTIFKDEGIFAFIEVYPRAINIKFIDSYQGKYIFPLFLRYDRVDGYEYFKSGKIVYFENNDLFLQGITNKTFTPRKNTCTSIDFTLDNRASVTLSETYPIEKEWKTVDKMIDVNTSHNFIRCPKRYDDFLYLLDYKNNIKSEYFDIEKLR